MLLIMVMAGFSSCKTARELPAERLKPISAEDLLTQVHYNAFEYEDLEIRKIQVQFSNSSTKTSFRASVKAIKNNKILASISKINIPLGRVLLTPDSVIYVNYIDKNYIVDDYSFLSNYFSFSLDFEIIQAILSNNIFAGREKSGNFAETTWDAGVENGRYVLQTAGRQEGFTSRGIFNRLRSSLYHTAHTGQQEKHQGVTQKMYFNRRTYSLERLLINDSENRWMPVSYTHLTLPTN